MSNSRASKAVHGAARNSQFSRRTFLGAGVGVAAAATLRMAGPAFADSVPSGQSTGPAPGPVTAPFGPVVVANPGGSYARAVRLSTAAPGKSTTLLGTYPTFFSGFPIYRSDDDGQTWQQQSSINVGGFALQPSFLELPRAFAGLPEGALLFACNSFGNFTSTQIQLYSSTDGGLTWQFVSTVAQGGPPNTTNGATPVWEPFLLLHSDSLICYYSDQRDPNYGQKISYQASTDLLTWGPVVSAATGTTYPERPGMATVARLRGDLWMMTYEFGKPVDPANPNQADYTYHVHYRIASDPESFLSSPDTPLVTQDGVVPNAAPVVSWSDWGGSTGTIIVTDNDHQDFFINNALGDPQEWTTLSSPMPAGYSRFTLPLDGPGSPPPQDGGLVFVITGPQYGVSGPVVAGVIQL